jgi:hypothetical protein
MTLRKYNFENLRSGSQPSAKKKKKQVLTVKLQIARHQSLDQIKLTLANHRNFRKLSLVEI